MRKVFGVLAVSLALGMGALCAQSRTEYLATHSELYMLGKLRADGDVLRDARARLDAAQKAHDENLKAFVTDAAKGHQITLRDDQTLGLTDDGRSFYVMDVAPVLSH